MTRKPIPREEPVSREKTWEEPAPRSSNRVDARREADDSPFEDNWDTAPTREMLAWEHEGLMAEQDDPTLDDELPWSKRSDPSTSRNAPTKPSMRRVTPSPASWAVTDKAGAEILVATSVRGGPPSARAAQHPYSKKISEIMPAIEAYDGQLF